MSRVCQHCSVPIVASPQSTKREWLAKRFCSSTCGMKAAGNMGGGQATADSQTAAARIATDQLRERMFSVYRSVASQRSLKSVWEAAVMLGMAA